MRRFTFILLAAIFALPVALAPAASAAPPPGVCRPGVVIALSLGSSPRVVHKGGTLTQTGLLGNCTARTLTITTRQTSLSPPACGPRITVIVGPEAIQAHSGGGFKGTGPAPPCLGTYTQTESVTIKGKVVATARTSFRVIP